jgi:glycosyltransferase involved in cell wall biosynthesis
MRKVLIVSPRFPPKSAPDLHRVRTSLPYYRQFGWEPTILCLTPGSADGVEDALLTQSVPEDIEIVRVRAWSEEKCRRFGFGHTDYRSWAPLFQAGEKLLKQVRYDVVFFSTTVFPSFLMGPIWKHRFGCRLVYDFQDPWYDASRSIYTKATAPGAWWKYRLGQRMACCFERRCMRSADHVISVSGGYVKDLSARYRWLRANQFTVLPFGVATSDFDIAERQGVGHGLFRRDKNAVHWVYAGRGGSDMNATLGVFFEQLRLLRQRAPEFAARLRVHFVGTNYGPQGRTRKLVEPLAVQHGVSDLIEEHVDRIPYYQALSLYSDADAILVIGSNSADYTASKFFNCVAAGKPVLALFHRESLVTKLAVRFPNVAVANFEMDAAEPEFAVAVARGMDWLQEPIFDTSKIGQELAPWSAEELTRVQCAIFSRVTGQ